MSHTDAYVNDVLDGNTIEIVLGVYPDSSLSTVNLARVYAPPLTRKEGREAKHSLKGFINRRYITYEIVGTGIRDMLSVEVWIDKTNVNDWMIDKGYGVQRSWPTDPDWPYIKERKEQ